MPHRNALDAAHAKIVALEAALEDARGGTQSDDALRAEIARLEMLLSAAHAERRVAEDRADRAEDELATLRADRARAEMDAMEREPPRASSARRDLRAMVPLDHHNRSLRTIAPTQGWEPLGVLCPRCAEEGERVELGKGLVTYDLGVFLLTQAICARCGFVGAKRDR